MEATEDMASMIEEYTGETVSHPDRTVIGNSLERRIREIPFKSHFLEKFCTSTESREALDEVLEEERTALAGKFEDKLQVLKDQLIRQLELVRTNALKRHKQEIQELTEAILTLKREQLIAKWVLELVDLDMSEELLDWCLRYMTIDDIRIQQGNFVTKIENNIEVRHSPYLHLQYWSRYGFMYQDQEERWRLTDIDSLYAAIHNKEELVAYFTKHKPRQRDEAIIRYLVLVGFAQLCDTGGKWEVTVEHDFSDA